MQWRLAHSKNWMDSTFGLESNLSFINLTLNREPLNVEPELRSLLLSKEYRGLAVVCQQ